MKTTQGTYAIYTRRIEGGIPEGFPGRIVKILEAECVIKHSRVWNITALVETITEEVIYEND